MAEVFERLDLSIPADVPDNMTMEKWIGIKLGRQPTKNEKIKANGIILETRKFRRHKLMEAIVSKAE